MRKVSGSRPAGYKKKKRKENGKQPGWYRGKKREKNRARERREDSAKKGARNAIKSSFIHTVSSDYPCIYSIP